MLPEKSFDTIRISISLFSFALPAVSIQIDLNRLNGTY